MCFYREKETRLLYILLAGFTYDPMKEHIIQRRAYASLSSLYIPFSHNDIVIGIAARFVA